MNTLENTLQHDLMKAMKAKDEISMGAIRSVKTAITESRTSAGGKKDLTDDDIIKIIQKQIKQRQDSIAEYTAAGRTELANTEQLEIDVLKNYTPTILDASETEAAVVTAISETGATSMKDMGRVMKLLSDKYGSRIDRSIASGIVRSRLS